jgi:hypothetical protein
MLAIHGKEAYGLVKDACLMGLKNAIEFTMPTNVKNRKTKEKKFNYARDNAISALGKIIKYQTNTIDPVTIVPNWLGLLPLRVDIDES